MTRSLLRSMHQLVGGDERLLVGGLPMLTFDPSDLEIDSPVLSAAFSHWQGSRTLDDALPTIRHIAPESLLPALGWFVIVDLVDQGDDFVYRLFGSEIAWRFNIDLTGRRVSEAPAPLGPFLVAAFRACAVARGPLLVEAACIHPSAGRVRALLLPWSDETAAVARVMAVVSLRGQRAVDGHLHAPALVRFRTC